MYPMLLFGGIFRTHGGAKGRRSRRERAADLRICPSEERAASLLWSNKRINFQIK